MRGETRSPNLPPACRGAVILGRLVKTVVGLRPSFSAHVRLECKVPGHPLHFVSRHPLHFRLIDPPAAGGRESGKRFAFSKAAMPPSFPPLVVSSGSNDSAKQICR